MTLPATVWGSPRRRWCNARGALESLLGTCLSLLRTHPSAAARRDELPNIGAPAFTIASASWPLRGTDLQEVNRRLSGLALVLVKLLTGFVVVGRVQSNRASPAPSVVQAVRPQLSNPAICRPSRCCLDSS